MKDVIQAIEWVDDSLRIIDQTKLPLELVRLRLVSHLDVIESIQTLAVRGAPAIGIAGAYAAVLAGREALKLDDALRCEFLSKALDEIEAARPTAVNLSYAVKLQREIVAENVAVAGEVVDEKLAGRLLGSAREIHERDRQMCDAIGACGAELVPEDSTALTICNAGALATGGIGTALGVLYVANERGKLKQVYSCETRPLLQGSRLTCWELQQSGIKVTLIIDSVAGALMKRGVIDFVIVGADRIAENGDTANKIGTYTLATLAQAHGIPFYVAAPETTFDRSLPGLSEELIERRAAQEVTCGFGAQTAPDGIAVYSPAFDITPKELISAFITDRGVIPGGRQ
jgi:methylthioribose-1-phosphate isomerase